MVTDRLEKIIKKLAGTRAIWSCLRGVYARLYDQDKIIKTLEDKIIVYEKVLEVLNGRHK